MHAVDDNKDVAEKLGPVDNTQLGAWDGLRGISRPEAARCSLLAVYLRHRVSHKSVISDGKDTAASAPLPDTARR
jgi:hypothetical protein